MLTGSRIINFRRRMHKHRPGQNRSFVAILIGACSFNVGPSGLAQIWVQTKAPTNYWQCVASSADGTVLAAAAGQNKLIGNFPGGVFISTNAGADWFEANLPANNFYSGIASSADGSRLAVTYNNGGVYYSMDYGVDWSFNSTIFPQAFGGLAHNIASSADGAKLAVSCSMIYTSTNGGVTWTSNNIAGPRYASIASSADGNKLAVASLSAPEIYLSTNAGLTWITNMVTNGDFQDIASSADGSHLIAAGSLQIAGPLYTSSDSGTTWVSNNVRTAWQAVAVSANGDYMAAASWPSAFSLSTNGVWATNSTPVAGQFIASMASSVDGGQWVAALQPGGIYVLQTIRRPQLNLASTSGGFLLSWMVPSTNFVLQQGTDLISWGDLTNTPSLNLTSLQYQVMSPLSNGSEFYRLATP